MVRTRGCLSLEDAMNFILKEEQFSQYKLSINSGHSSQSHPPVYRTRPTISNTTTNRYQTPAQFQQNYRPANHFPQGPINIQPRQVPTRYPTNAQVFGKPQNVFKPGQTTNTYKPTPMSGVSVQPKRSNYYQPPQRQGQFASQPFQRSNFQQQSRPTFHSEELFNSELDITPQHVSCNYFYNPNDPPPTLEIPEPASEPDTENNQEEMYPNYFPNDDETDFLEQDQPPNTQT